MKFKILNLKLKIADFVRKNKVELIILGAILLIGGFFRLYKISEYMTFLGDEGRDMILIRRIFTELHPPLIGPGTSVGGMYLGPLYYYLMAIPLLVSGFSPVGPSVTVAIIGLATIMLVWFIGRKWFDKTTGLIAAGLYAISPTVIYFSRSSWNPNVMPFFALLSVYSIWKVWKERKFNWSIILGISYAFVLQSHYLGLLLAPTLFLFWILTLFNLKSIQDRKLGTEKFLKKSLLGLLIFSVLMSPLLIFDLRHGFMNSKAVIAFFAGENDTLSLNFVNLFSSIPRIFNQIIESLIGSKNIIAGFVSSLFVILGLVVFFVQNLFKKGKKVLLKINDEWLILLAWLFLGIVGLGVYQKSIYDHYFGFLFPVPFILISVFISRLVSGKTIFKIFGYLLLAFLVYISLINNPLRKAPNRLLARSIHVADVIGKNSNGEPFNLGVIADTNYVDGYKYFLLKDGYSVIDIDPQLSNTITTQLFVVCELLPNEKCDPTHSPKAEIANFGWSTIEEIWEVDGALVYKLVHSI